MKNVSDDKFCFVCGIKNKNGLQLSFSFNEETNQVISKVTFDKEYQGWSGVVHGGLVATVLDEIMVKTAEFKDLKCVTVEISVKYKKPALVGVKYNLNSEILSINKKLVYVRSEMISGMGEIIASAEGKLFIVK